MFMYISLQEQAKLEAEQKAIEAKAAAMRKNLETDLYGQMREVTVVYKNPSTCLF